MKPQTIVSIRYRTFLVLCIAVVVACSHLLAQQTVAATSASGDRELAVAVQELRTQVEELRMTVAEMKSEAAQYRAQSEELRKELENIRANAPSTPATTNTESGGAQNVTSSANSVTQRVASLEETTQLLESEIRGQYQTKIESASKYRVRFSGIVLLNLFSNRGTADSLDVPTWATPSGPSGPKGTFGASLRQSELGLEVFGPRLAGANTSGNLQFDFSGGFPNTFNGVTFGLARLRIASMRMAWEHTSVIAGQDDAFISPLSPTSFASLAVPALGYAGNLWGWIPQVRVEHRIDLSEEQNLTLQAGILDNLTGETPYDSFLRTPSAGERSSQPAYGVRIAWTRNVFGRPVRLATAGYYSRQDWGFNRHVDGWAGMADWDLPLAPRVSLSGEFYRGIAIGGLAGGFGRSVLFSGDPAIASTQVRGLDAIGGWSQLKFKASEKLEFNGAFGLDNPFAEDLRAFAAPQSYFFPALAQNRGGMLNFIYRPRSDLLFSGEYRDLRTFFLGRNSSTADQVNLMMGVLF